MMNKAILTHLKAKLILPPQLKDNGDLAGNLAFDLAGVDAALILLGIGVTDVDLGSGAEDVPVYLEECDTDSVTAGDWAKITGSDLAEVVQDDDDGKLIGWFIDRAKTRKRFVRIHEPHSADGTTGATACAIAIGLPDIPPVTAAQMGLKELIQV
jgi:hypothetical protein